MIEWDICKDNIKHFSVWFKITWPWWYSDWFMMQMGLLILPLASLLVCVPSCWGWLIWPQNDIGVFLGFIVAHNICRYFEISSKALPSQISQYPNQIPLSTLQQYSQYTSIFWWPLVLSTGTVWEVQKIKSVRCNEAFYKPGKDNTYAIPQWYPKSNDNNP